MDCVRVKSLVLASGRPAHVSPSVGGGQARTWNATSGNRGAALMHVPPAQAGERMVAPDFRGQWMETKYLNTDLDVVSAGSPRALERQLAKLNMIALRSERQDGLWYSIFETDGCQASPSATITVMLDALESLTGAALECWRMARSRDFNIGYDCGSQPWGFTSRLPAGLLKRVAAVNANVVVTLYPADVGPKAPTPPTADGGPQRA